MKHEAWVTQRNESTTGPLAFRLCCLGFDFCLASFGFFACMRVCAGLCRSVLFLSHNLFFHAHKPLYAMHTNGRGIYFRVSKSLNFGDALSVESSVLGSCCAVLGCCAGLFAHCIRDCAGIDWPIAFFHAEQENPKHIILS